MKKNLVLLHLDGVSQMAFWQYSECMPTLYGLMREACDFARCYSASTSSVMCMADVLYGDSSKLDHLEEFPSSQLALDGGASNLFQRLFDMGYSTLGVQYGARRSDDTASNFWGIWPEDCGPFQWRNDREALHRDVRGFFEESKRKEQPFALYFWNRNANVCEDDVLKPSGQPYHEYLKSGYRLLDMSIQRFIQDLNKTGLLDNTMIVAFGDHGDDLYRHGPYCQRDPYATVCAVPMFIYDRDVEISINTNLVSLVDLKATILHILSPDSAAEKRATPTSGIDLLTEMRPFAFTQSMFALQHEKRGPDGAMTKSYAITDNNYRLMVSSPAYNGDSGGLEFFLDQWDYGSTRNLLDFCRLDNSGAIIRFGPEDAEHPHFLFSFTKKNAIDMLTVYDTLRKTLYSLVKMKESEAMKLASFDHEPHLFSSEFFTRKRQKHMAAKS